MKKIFLKLALYIMPFVVISIAAAFLPLNYFSYRCWEALSVKPDFLLPGPFYPFQKMVMTEEGDMGHGTPYAIKKKAYWETDRYGYRKKDSDEHPDIVIIGDSNIAGGSLTQEDTFAEVLQRKLQRSVYPYAPDDINHFIHDTRFTANPPRVVILEIIERSILSHEQLQIKPKPQLSIKLKMKSLTSFSNRHLIQAAIVFSRILKLELLNKLKNKIEPKTIGFRYHGMFFYQGATADISAKDSEMQNTIKIISAYNDYFKKNHIFFIYMPIPNKETIYYDFLPSKPGFSILKQVLQGLKPAGVPTIDLLRAFEAFRQDGGNPFQIDDTHWSAMGVTIAADLVADMILHSE